MYTCDKLRLICDMFGFRNVLHTMWGGGKGKIEYSVNDSQGGMSAQYSQLREREKGSVCVRVCMCLFRGGGHHEYHWGLLDPRCCLEQMQPHIHDHKYASIAHKH